MNPYLLLILLTSWSLLVTHAEICDTGVAFTNSVLSVGRSSLANADVALLKSYNASSVEKCMEECCAGKYASGTAEPLIGLLPMLCPLCRPYRRCKRCPCMPSSYFSQITGQFPPRTGEISVPPVQVTGQFPPVTGQFPPVTGQFPPVTGQLSVPPAQVPPITAQFPPITARFPSISAQLYRSMKQTGQQPDIHRRVLPDGEIPRQVSMPTGQIIWNNLTISEIAARASQPTEKVTGQLPDITGKIAMPSGEVDSSSPLEIHFDPTTGQLVLPTYRQLSLSPKPTYWMVDPALRDIIYSEMTDLMANQHGSRMKNSESEYPEIEQYVADSY